ncbi:hypothetical protein F5890DRAFT_1531388 [Lentinula detonsa]|uniref:Uncharacterized protein n=1 Tax=Lentinula detonsa TaxID=2804962 RepID=A0AA38PV39_9AGAR|nr:hypothetical protein F5890DRAFT_1531388 [Lentinula detonsa]
MSRTSKVWFRKCAGTTTCYTGRNWVERVEAGEELNNHQLRAVWNVGPQLPILHPSPYSNNGIGPDPAHLQFQDIPTHISQAMRPFDLTAALSGLPAMSGSAVPGPGPVVCGYHGWGTISKTSLLLSPQILLGNLTLQRVPLTVIHQRGHLPTPIHQRIR